MKTSLRSYVEEGKNMEDSIAIDIEYVLRDITKETKREADETKKLRLAVEANTRVMAASAALSGNYFDSVEDVKLFKNILLAAARRDPVEADRIEEQIQKARAEDSKRAKSSKAEAQFARERASMMVGKVPVQEKTAKESDHGTSNDQ